VNRRCRDHVPVAGLDHLAGADQVAGPGRAPVREPVAPAGPGRRAGGRRPSSWRARGTGRSRRYRRRGSPPVAAVVCSQVAPAITV
jgi:hypothetical protein